MSAGGNRRKLTRIAFFAIAAAATAVVLAGILQLRFDQYPERLSGVFPVVCLALLALFAGLEGFGAARAGSSGVTGIDLRLNRLIRVSALAAAYVAVMTVIGFALATLLFQGAVLAYVFEQRGLRLIMIPVSLTVAVVALFSVLLAVPLPRGIGWFYALNSLWL